MFNGLRAYDAIYLKEPLRYGEYIFDLDISYGLPCIYTFMTSIWAGRKRLGLLKTIYNIGMGRSVSHKLKSSFGITRELSTGIGVSYGILRKLYRRMPLTSGVVKDPALSIDLSFGNKLSQSVQMDADAGISEALYASTSFDVGKASSFDVSVPLDGGIIASFNAILPIETGILRTCVELLNIYAGRLRIEEIPVDFKTGSFYEGSWPTDMDLGAINPCIGLLLVLIERSIGSNTVVMRRKTAQQSVPQDTNVQSSTTWGRYS
jgi:hypothetical protein